MNKCALVLSMLLVTVTAFAQEDPTFERVLVPVVIDPAPGGFGSIWSTELFFFNGASSGALVEYSFGCTITCPSGLLIEPNVAQVPPGLLAPPLARPGMLVYVQRPQNEAFTFGLRVKDLSRQSLTWGTEVPVIRERDVRTTTIQLLNIPLDGRFRQNIRFYDLDARSHSVVRIRYFAMDGGALLAEQEIALQAPDNGGNPRPLQPGYAIVGNVATVPGLGGADRVRAEITPVTAALNFWAFASVTNNETQHVTTITPQ